MLSFLTKDVDIAAVKSSILVTLSRRNFEADGLMGHLRGKPYHVEMALHQLIQEGQVVSYWTDSGAYQRHFYALTENFNTSQPVMQVCASPEALEQIGPINLKTRPEMRQDQAGKTST
jgi:hypothetical protein